MKACLESDALGDVTVQGVFGKVSHQFYSTHPEQAAKLVIEYLRTSYRTLEFPSTQSADMPEDL